MITEAFAGEARGRHVCFNPKYNEGVNGPLMGFDGGKLKAGVDIVVTPCFHAMERTYAYNWLETHDECPECRQTWQGVFLLPNPGKDIDTSTLIKSRLLPNDLFRITMDNTAAYFVELMSNNSLNYLNTVLANTPVNEFKVTSLQVRLQPENLIMLAKCQLVDMCLIYGIEEIKRRPLDYLSGQWCEQLKELEQYALCYDFMCRLPIMRQCAVERYMLMFSKYFPFVPKNVANRLNFTFGTKVKSVIDVTLQRFESVAEMNDTRMRIMGDVKLLMDEMQDDWHAALEPYIGTRTVPAEESVDDAVERIMKVCHKSFNALSQEYTTYLIKIQNGRVFGGQATRQMTKVLRNIEVSRLEDVVRYELKRKVESASRENRTFLHLFKEEYWWFEELSNVQAFSMADEILRIVSAEEISLIHKYNRVLGHFQSITNDVWNENRGTYVNRVKHMLNNDFALSTNLDYNDSMLRLHRQTEQWILEAWTKLVRP